MTPTQWMGAIIATLGTAYWIYDGLRTAGDKVRAARRYAFDEQVRTAGVRDLDAAYEQLCANGGEVR